MTPTFAELTTMRVGGPTKALVVAGSTQELLEAVRELDGRGEPLLLLGGGSNLVVGDTGWDGTTVKIESSEIEIDGTTVRADAGVDWDELVALTVDAGLSGFETLSGVPGSVGGTPVQNVGAYGTLTSEVLRSVTVFDREAGQVEDWGVDRCGFGSHRQSVFRRTDRYVVLRVEYELRRAQQPAPLYFSRLVERLGMEPGGTAAPASVRTAVIELRRERGSIYDEADHDTWGVGSFFINPVLETVPPRAQASPTYPDVLGTKLPAGWLIEHAGFPPGYGADWGRGTVRLSTKHALAMCNWGGATTAEVMAFAAHIREGVEACFDIRLGPECLLVNCSFDDVVPAAALRAQPSRAR